METIIFLDGKPQAVLTFWLLVVTEVAKLHILLDHRLQQWYMLHKMLTLD